MFGSLACGIVFAIGHHFFYQSLVGKVVTTESYYIFGQVFEQQQVNLAAGNVFAMLVEVALSYAMSVAYIQLLWQTVRSPISGVLLSYADRW